MVLEPAMVIRTRCPAPVADAVESSRLQADVPMQSAVTTATLPRVGTIVMIPLRSLPGIVLPGAVAHVVAADHKDHLLCEVGRVIGNALELSGYRDDRQARCDVTAVFFHPRDHFSRHLL